MDTPLTFNPDMWREETGQVFSYAAATLQSHPVIAAVEILFWSSFDNATHFHFSEHKASLYFLTDKI